MALLTVSGEIRLEHIKYSLAPVIFETIDRDRNYLKTWLPFVDFTLHLSDTEKFLHEVLNDSSGRKKELFSIWYNNEFAGLIGFNDIDWTNKKTEIGYWIAEKMQGKGIVTLCTKKLLWYAFEKLKLNRVQIKVARENPKSAAVPKRIGFVFEGIERSGEKIKNMYYDLEVYSMLKKDYPDKAKNMQE